jgi:hypothetical protein
MKVIEVKKLVFDTARPSLDEISARLDREVKANDIDTINWTDFSYKPQVSFAIARTAEEILLKYHVREDYFKAEKTETNQMVCEDSCVEFFVSPETDGIYYNFEFNGIGTCLLGTGTERANSTRCDPGVVSAIRRKSTMGTEPVPGMEGDIEWSITIAIPLEAFFHHKIGDLEGRSFRANFYKCGDLLKVPHYVTWNPVGTENPDYHRPEYFGLLKFI